MPPVQKEYITNLNVVQNVPELNILQQQLQSLTALRQLFIKVLNVAQSCTVDCYISDGTVDRAGAFTTKMPLRLKKKEEEGNTKFKRVKIFYTTNRVHITRNGGSVFK